MYVYWDLRRIVCFQRRYILKIGSLASLARNLVYIFSSFQRVVIQSRGGGGGYSDLVRRGCAAEAAKPIPIFKGHFGGKGYLLLRVFSQENDVFVYFSDEMGRKLQKWGVCLGIFSSKPYPMLGIFLKKVTY